MKATGIKPGELRMFIDCDEPQWSPGRYGEGLATALGTLEWLPLLPPGALIFEQVQFSLPHGRAFIFSLSKYQLDRQIDLDFVEFAEAVRKSVLQGDAPSAADAHVDERPPRVVVAKRRPEESRILANAEELAAHLQVWNALQLSGTTACMTPRESI